MTEPHPTPRLHPVIRLFVSSTFSDMRHERNALQELVYPNLEQLCQKNGFQFQAIDLRWGVSTEAGLDHRAMRICFEELRRSQEISPEPNFLVLLGNRFGWRPLPEGISQAEFDRLATAAESGGEGGSPITGTHGKTARQVLDDWYRCDENVLLPDPSETDPDRVPLNYILQPRTQNLGDERDYTRTQDEPPKDTQDWLDVQQVLWGIINAAFPSEALDHRFENLDWARHAAEVCDWEHLKRPIPQIARFQASATEQEIWGGALSAPNAERHVLAFFREIVNGDMFSPVDVTEFFDRTDAGDIDTVAAARQTALKAVIRLRLGPDAVGSIPFSRLKRENGKVLVAASEDETRDFCKTVETRLQFIIERQIEQYWQPPQRATVERTVRELEIEQQEHARIGQERGGAEAFVGREDKLKAIHDYLLNDSTSPLVIHGASGCGKTALMARAAQETESLVSRQRPLVSAESGEDPTKNQEPGTKNSQTITRFLGTTPRSSDLRGLITSLCQELRLRYPREGELPTDIKLLEVELQEQFKAATPERPLILFLDALDQLADTDGGRNLHWIPVGPLPAHVKLVVSCLSERAKDDPAGQPYAELQRRQLPATNFINLDAFSEDEARTLLFKRWLPQAERTVSPDQRARIEQRLTSNTCRQPIYLKLLFEEARLWRSYDATPDLGEGVPALLEQLFNRLSLPTNHGRLLVERVLGYLAASREGLAENETLEILFRDPEYKAALDQATEATRHEMPPNATRIPIAIWSRLRFDLASYLTERAATGANVLTFYHRQVAEWVHEHFAKASDQSWQPHPLLAEYFCELADPEKNQRWKGGNPRPFLALPFHLVHAGMWAALVATLEDIFFLEAKNTHGLAFDLIADFDDTVRQLPSDNPQYRILSLLEEGLRRDIHFIARHARDFPQALFQCLWNTCWWHDCPETNDQDRNDESLSNDSAPKISTLLQTWRQKRQRELGPFAWLRRLCPPPFHLGSALCGVIPAHTRAIRHLDISTHGDELVTLSRDGSVAFWSLPNGKLLLSLESLEPSAQTVSFQPDGAVILTRAGAAPVRIQRPMGERTEVPPIDAILPTSVSNDASERCEDWPSNEPGNFQFGTNFNMGDIQSLFRINLGNRLSTEQVCAFGYNPSRGLLACGLIAAKDIEDGTLAPWTPFNSSFDLFDAQDVEKRTLVPIIILWNTRTGQVMTTIGPEEGMVRTIQFSANGEILVYGLGKGTVTCDSEQGCIVIWDTTTCKERTRVWTFTDGGVTIRRISIAPDLRTVASSDTNGCIRFWDIVSGQDVAQFDTRTAIEYLSFASNGKSLITGSDDGKVRLWNVEKLRRKESSTGRARRGRLTHYGRVSAIEFSPDGRLLATGSAEMCPGFNPVPTVYLREALTGRALARLEGGSGAVSVLAFSPDGRLLLLGDDWGVRFWDSSELGNVEGRGFSAVCIDAVGDGRAACFGRKATEVAISVSDPELGVVLCDTGSKDDARGVYTALAGLLGDGTVRRWHLLRPTSCLAISRSGDLLAVGCADGSISIFETLTTKLQVVIGGNRGSVSRLAFGVGDSEVYSAYHDAIMDKWDRLTGKCIERRRVRGDLFAWASGPASYPLLAVSNSEGTEVQDAFSGRVIGYYAARLDIVACHPSKPVFAGSGDPTNHVDMFTLERG